MHNVNYEINVTSKSRDLVDFFLFLWGRENPERGKDTFLLKIPIPHANWGQTHNSLQKPHIRYETKIEVRLRLVGFRFLPGMLLKRKCRCISAVHSYIWT